MKHTYKQLQLRAYLKGSSDGKKTFISKNVFIDRDPAEEEIQKFIGLCSTESFFPLDLNQSYNVDVVELFPIPNEGVCESKYDEQRAEILAEGHY